MTIDDYKIGFRMFLISTAIFAALLPISFAFGCRLGHQCTTSSREKIHHEMQTDGYNYCPYCGESLEVEE